MILVLIVIERSEPTGKALTSQLVEFDDATQMYQAQDNLMNALGTYLRITFTILKGN